MAEGGGGPGLVHLFWNAERSRRMLMVKALLNHAERDPRLLGPLPAADTAWVALARAQRREPAATDRALLHPQVGAALAFALRRLAAPAGSGPPLWVDFGQIHALALTTAAGARLTWRTVVPLREGRVALPGLGLVQFPGAESWGYAVARTQGGRIWLDHGGDEVTVPADPSTDAPGWWGLRRLSVGTRPALTVWLDDVDPFRDLAEPVGPARLGAAQLSQWHDLLDRAWHIICTHRPELATALAAGVTSLVPLPAAEDFDGRSASTGEAFGSVMVAMPSDPTLFAVSLVHEFQHIKLGGLLHLVPLAAPEETAHLYAPWRDDPRPLGGLTQGAYAFFGIARFWRAYRQSLTGPAADQATFEYMYARDQTLEALETLRSSPALTPLGRDFTNRMHQHLTSWLVDDQIPPAVARMASLAAASHRAGWRIRHLRPAQADVMALARAFTAGAEPVPPTLSPAVSPEPPKGWNWSRGRLGLVRLALAAPHRCRDALRTAPWAAGLTEADVALATGDARAARDGFLARLTDDPTDLDAWTGLGLALSAVGGIPAETAAGAALLTRPDLVLAVSQELQEHAAAPSPVRLAAWLAPVAEPGL